MTWTNLRQHSNGPASSRGPTILDAIIGRLALRDRDFLRSHPAAAATYAELKRRLAALEIDSGLSADLKDPTCDIIVAATEELCTRAGEDSRAA